MVFQVFATNGNMPERILEKCFKFYLIDSMEKRVEVYGTRISTLEELMDFKKLSGHALIINTSRIDGKTPCIEIYNYNRGE